MVAELLDKQDLLGTGDWVLHVGEWLPYAYKGMTTPGWGWTVGRRGRRLERWAWVSSSALPLKPCKTAGKSIILFKPLAPHPNHERPYLVIRAYSSGQACAFRSSGFIGRVWGSLYSATPHDLQAWEVLGVPGPYHASRLDFSVVAKIPQLPATDSYGLVADDLCLGWAFLRCIL